jgi:uncharacterized protein (DUF486 family)
MKKILITACLLLASNTFMNIAWYGHLKYKDRPLGVVVLVAWGIAFFEYCLQVPANRLGDGVLTLTQLKVMQEFFSLTTFGIVSFVLFRERLTVNHGVAFVFLMLAAFFAVRK